MFFYGFVSTLSRSCKRTTNAHYINLVKDNLLLPYELHKDV